MQSKGGNWERGFKNSSRMASNLIEAAHKNTEKAVNRE
jgi:hypothetical protein